MNGTLSSITFHKLVSKTVDSTTGDATSVTFNSTACGTISYDWDTAQASYQGDTKIALPTYDPLNREQPLLLMFHLIDTHTPGNGTLHIDGVTDTAGFLGERNADATPKYALNSNAATVKTETVDQVVTRWYWLSSVVQFYNVTFANDSLSYTYGLTQAYATANNIPELKNSNSRFVTVNNAAETSSFSNRATMYSSTSGTTVKNIGVVIDYFPDAIDYIYSTYLGDSTLEDDYEGVLRFGCDWSMEIV